MTLCEAIVEARGTARCALSRSGATEVTALAREFGLSDDPFCYREIDVETAIRLLTAVLHRDMAYNSEQMPEAQAHQLAVQFLAVFEPGARYFTNGDWHMVGADSHSWNPATAATFDTGVIAVGTRVSGCVWVEDED